MLLSTGNGAAADISAAGSAFAIALGCFDGVHTGHAALFHALSSSAGGLSRAAFTFAPSPDGGPCPVKRSAALVTFDEKLRLLFAAGAEYAFVYPFDRLADMSPREFVERVLIGECRCALAVCGYNFTFGRGAAGNAETLTSLLAEHGIATVVMPPYELDGEPVSSAAIRRALTEGEPERAARLLGRVYTLTGEVVHGAHLGTALGFPTINMKFFPGSVLPRFGVYISETEIEGRKYPSVSNIGIRPTVDGNGVNCETHLLDYSGDAYGATARVGFLSYLREETRFSSGAELADAIRRDVAAAELYFGKSPDKKDGAAE